MPPADSKNNDEARYRSSQSRKIETKTRRILTLIRPRVQVIHFIVEVEAKYV